jgi:hypothetical protein
MSYIDANGRTSMSYWINLEGLNGHIFQILSKNTIVFFEYA